MRLYDTLKTIEYMHMVTFRAALNLLDFLDLFQCHSPLECRSRNFIDTSITGKTGCQSHFAYFAEPYN